MKEFKAPVRYNQRELLIAYLSGRPVEYSLIGYDTWFFCPSVSRAIGCSTTE